MLSSLVCGSNRTPALLLVLLLAITTLAGCLGDDGADPADGPDLPATTPDPEPTPEDELEETIEKAKEDNENVPAAHYHHYWGTPAKPSVVIFDGDVTLTTDDCFNSENQGETACIGPEPRVGSVEFNLEDDGDQITADERRPEVDGHADTVFVGTSLIRATFTWDAAQLGNELLLFYKPANSPVYFPLEGTGITVSADDAQVTIPLSPGMADPAHQFRVSRWAFKLVANSGPQEQWPGYVYAGIGEVTVLMEAINGGKEAIDPPHPDPWQGRDVIDHGEVTGSFVVTQAHLENGEVTQPQYVRGDGSEGIQLPSRAIVPTGTQKLVVTATVTPKDELSAQMDWGLKWHGASDKTYQLAESPETGDDGERIYTIPIDDYIVDPPYVAESFFEFGFYPIINGQAQSGNYEADYTLAFEIHRDPKFTYFP